MNSLFVFAGMAQDALRSKWFPEKCGPGPAANVQATRLRSWQSVFAGQRALTETFLETVQEVECLQNVDKVYAAQGRPTSSQRNIGDTAFHDVQSAGSANGHGAS